MPETRELPSVAGGGVVAAIDPHGGGLARMAAPAEWITGPGAVTVLAADDGAVTTLVGPDATWAPLDGAAGGSGPTTATLIAGGDTGGVTASVTATVGDFGLAVVHGVTNAADAPVRVGLVVRLHPDGGDDAVVALCGAGAPDEPVGADTAVVPGRAVADPSLAVDVGGGRPLAGKTHVVHRLRAPGGGERLRIWGDAGFTHTRAHLGDGTVELELRTAPGRPQPDDLHEIAPGETWMISWGLQPDGFSGPEA